MRCSRKAPRPGRLVTPTMFPPQSSGGRIGKRLPGRGEETPAFAPVVIAAASPSSPRTASGAVEIAIGDAVVRVIDPVEPSVLIAVLRAVRRTS